MQTITVSPEKFIKIFCFLSEAKKKTSWNLNIWNFKGFKGGKKVPGADKISCFFSMRIKGFFQRVKENQGNLKGFNDFKGRWPPRKNVSKPFLHISFTLANIVHVNYVMVQLCKKKHKKYKIK